jgi:PAS domain S-box-containing protein
VKKKSEMIKLIKIWVIIIIISIGTSIIIFDIFYSYKNFYTKANEMRENYIESQKNVVKNEVKRVIELINSRNYRLINFLKDFAKERNDIIYNYIINFTGNNDKSIKPTLIKNLQFIKSNEINTYIVDLDNKSIINFNNNLKECKLPLTSIIEFTRYSKEGMFEFHCDKKINQKNPKRFIFYKIIKRLNWIIITELNCSNQIVKSRKESILYDISKIRFGKEGYIFVNKFNGDALVSNGKVFGKNIKLWEIFPNKKQKLKEIFRKELEAAMKPEGDFINYTWIKLTNSNILSKKTSFIQSFPEFEWIVGAGFYHDEIEKEISAIYKELNLENKKKLLVFTIVVIFIVILFLIMFNNFINKLNKEVSFFIYFFNKATNTKEKINIDNIQFIEFEKIAQSANKMLSELWNIQNKLSSIIESSPDPIYFKDTEGVIRIANQAYLNLYDLQKKDIINKNFNEIKNIVHPIYKETFETCKKSDLKAWNTKKYFHIDEEIIRKPNGESLIFEVIKVPIFDENKNKTGLLIIGRDITARKKIEKDLRKMEIVVEQSPVSILIINKDAKIEYVNSKYCETRGISKEELLNKHPDFLISESISDKEKMRIKETISQGKIWTGEVPNKNKKGELYWENIIISSIHNENNEVSHFVIIKEDITKRKMLELELKKANENLKAQIKQELEKIRMQEVIIQQQKRFADMGQMINAIAHQWRQPLNNISLIMQIIKKIYDGEDYDMDINDLFEQHTNIVRFMSNTIDDFRNYFSVKKDKCEFVITKEILNTIALLKAQLQNNKINLEIFYRSLQHKDFIPIENDNEYDFKDIFYGLAGEFRQVILNIINNAKDAILEKRKNGWNKGEIKIFIDTKESEIEIIIFNSGDPIPENTINRIFDPYYTTKDKDKGTGIGLYMSKTIIENEMKGSIFVKNLKNGVEFHIILPLTK